MSGSSEMSAEIDTSVLALGRENSQRAIRRLSVLKKSNQAPSSGLVANFGSEAGQGRAGQGRAGQGRAGRPDLPNRGGWHGLAPRPSSKHSTL